MKIGRILHLFAYLAFLNACKDRKHDGTSLLGEDNVATEGIEESEEDLFGEPAKSSPGTLPPIICGRGLRAGGRAWFRPSNDALVKMGWKLWNADKGSRAEPTKDFIVKLGNFIPLEKPLQGPFTKLFEYVNDKRLPQIKTYKALWNVFDAHKNSDETVKRKSEKLFFQEVAKTEPYRVLREILVNNSCDGAKDPLKFYKTMETLWIGIHTIYRTDRTTSFIQHYFLGIINPDGALIGLHYWLRIYYLELNGRLQYAGKINDRYPLLPYLRFKFDNAWKSQSATLMGPSPEFEIALISLAYFARYMDPALFYLRDCTPVFFKTNDWSDPKKQERYLTTAFPKPFNPETAIVTCPGYIQNPH